MEQIAQWEMYGGGQMRVWEDGLRARVEVWCRQGSGVYKAEVWGERGGRYLLGTLIPEGEEMRLSRMMSLRELERAGCWPIGGGRLLHGGEERKLQRDGWRQITHAAGLVCDPVLQRQMPGTMLYRGGEGQFSLAARFRPDCPFPIPGLMCLARVEQWDGGRFAVWDFTPQGEPLCPPAQEKWHDRP